jgi:Domain of unknown function (DUF4440)
VSSENKSATMELEDLNKEILACEKKVYENFLGPKPKVEVLKDLLLPDYLYINFRGFIWTKEENLTSLSNGVSFSSIEVKDPQVRRISQNSAVIVARVLAEVVLDGRSLSTQTLTSTVWVKQDGKWLAQLHTSTAAAQG